MSENVQQEGAAEPPAVQQERNPIGMGDRGVVLRNLDEMWRFSNMIAKSGLAPASLKTPESIMIAMEMGLEVGLPPMASMQNIAVINGRPSIWGDAMKGVCEASGLMADYHEKEVGTPYNDDYGFSCFALRKGREHGSTNTFTVADAKRAKLWEKVGPWTQYPKRMLKYRARSFTLRDEFPDVLKGLYSAEEAQDMPPKDIPFEDATERGAAAVAKVQRKPPETTTTADSPPVGAAGLPDAEPVGKPMPSEYKPDPAPEQETPDDLPDETPAPEINADLTFVLDHCKELNMDFDVCWEGLKREGLLAKNFPFRTSPKAYTDKQLDTLRAAITKGAAMGG